MKSLSTLGLSLLACLVLLPAQALPTDFNDKVESALLCRSEWSTAFWHDYFNTHLQASIRDWGEARWWEAQGAQLGGVGVVELFANLDDSRVLMIGALIQQPVESVKQTLEEHYRMQFQPVQASDGVRYVSDNLSVLVGTRDQQTKWYCARWNMGNRERTVPLAPR
ncbi:hypothetical protein [Chitinimonas koreensis]|uniref:hypothetical protein n=1 Tax=Chitinimonas koreensis TaxID=356302 RepID=UPI0012F7C888|nr:hypothetical protein [Chitinimonas koreensis]QNM96234.1 hypothetical protein H9L41_20895 [Chitinimonas koreensis]